MCNSSKAIFQNISLAFPPAQLHFLSQPFSQLTPLQPFSLPMNPIPPPPPILLSQYSVSNYGSQVG